MLSSERVRVNGQSQANLLQEAGEEEDGLTMNPQAMEVRFGTVDPRLGAAAPHHVDAGLHGEQDLANSIRCGRLNGCQGTESADLNFVTEAAVRGSEGGEAGALGDNPVSCIEFFTVRT